MAIASSIGAASDRVRLTGDLDPSTGFDKVTQVDKVTLVPRRPTVTRGQSSVELEVRLPKNAVVRRFDLLIQARRAAAAAAGEVAQVRPAESRAGGAVLDFGLVRTVSGFDPPVGFEVRDIYLWMGTGFAPNPHFSAGHPPQPGIVSARFDEARTERLLVVLDRAATPAQLAEDGFVVLPEPPADLELRIDGGPPVWTFAGPVLPGEGSEPDADSWSAEGERIVPLAAALAPLVGDPLGEGEVTLRLALSSRVPGLLALVEVTQEVSTVSRATLGVPEGAPGGASGAGPSPSRDLDFPAEGQVRIDLGLPAADGRLVEEVRFTLLGSLGEERTLDPVWPEDEAGEPLAELAVDPEHAFAVGLSPLPAAAAAPPISSVSPPATDAASAPEPPPPPSISRLAELTGVRLPLLAGPAGAEARVALWREATGEPAEPVEGGLSEPLTLDPPAGAAASAPTWTTFPFKTPVKLTAGERLWAALLVARGAVSWRLAVADRASYPVRRGTAPGPWFPLPAVFGTDPDLLRRTGAVRVTGKAVKEAPLAPLQVGIEGAVESLEATPAAKGSRSTLTFAEPLPADTPRLAVTSRLAGKVALREVDVVWSEQEA